MRRCAVPTIPEWKLRRQTCSRLIRPTTAPNFGCRVPVPERTRVGLAHSLSGGRLPSLPPTSTPVLPLQSAVVNHAYSMIH